MKAELNNKVVLITGASQGLGRYFATVLAKTGALVVVTSLKSEMDKLNNLVEEIIASGGKALAFELDLRVYAEFFCDGYLFT